MVSKPRRPSLSLRAQVSAQARPFQSTYIREYLRLAGYTISRAILSDAFALTRGDRFYTQDFTPYNLTAWGFADCQRDPDAYGFGSTLGRLFLRTLPNHYSKDSVYTWFPLVHPDAMEGYLKNLGKVDGYDAARPKPSEPATTVNGYVEVGQVLRSTDKYVPEYVERAAEVLKGKGCVHIPAWVWISTNRMG